MRIYYTVKFIPQFPETRDWSFVQLKFRKIRIEFQRIQLIFGKFKKQFLNFQLRSFEYSDTLKPKKKLYLNL